MTEQAKKRPEFRNINVFTDLPSYRLPAAGILSILHRVSGMILFLLLPFIMWMFDTSLSSEISYGSFTSVFQGTWGWFAKLVCLALIWGYLHHFCAGVRHLAMDMNHHIVNKEFGKTSALVCFAVSLLLTVVLGAKLFGLF
ncbi:succinate dehydrogenase, cytochrome b556 subunit [Diaphorobacter aerolatus]|uniref:Succinate dehydrogenase cytochrome b556 subunit n=1 Tax=Diaphorobacter aerolatus TaxID=1288495 RepID=A0A7H0GMA4_9BURK|nr:succinate dehydrogenase, cytochrome b556 subunit [Diaphorobacter aerolatus]QNP49420.1 succinate dehydrogenase, cytochrome b556 subunit [Diaphorobacter aerolatus]